MQYSIFGRKFLKQTGIGQLMDDLSNSPPGSCLLGGGNPAFIPELIEVWREIVSKQIESGSMDKILGGYESPSGILELREMIASILSNESGTKISKDQIAITNGSQNAFYFLLNFFSGNFGNDQRKKILFPILPEYIGYTDQTLEPDSFLSFTPEIREIEDRYYKYFISLENFDSISSWKKEAGCICVSRPTNPTGNMITDQELEFLIERASNVGIPLLVDNAYGFPFPKVVFGKNSFIHRPGMIQGFSLSKLGLPGVRTGFVVGDSKTITLLHRANSVINLTSANPGQFIALDLFRSGRWKELCEKIILPFYLKKSIFTQETILNNWNSKIDYKIHQSEGAFFLWVWVRNLSLPVSDLYPILKEAGVIIVPGKTFFPGTDSNWSHREECFRLSFARDDKEIEEGILRIGKVLEKFLK
ncbi:valine--pyruvate transaminase [Leptospira noguchii]|uniref:Aminotransferase, class I/II domain protein n=1 Tax=Leptospira noguchii serovar Autumnalis str. ZUN142 TaxID=1085540 RepID=M6UBY6_9LEPT|nr:valine--pyruvate transaminase [Leptospira noguchii]EMO42532.1 aminotransferase, class I/II domain protein [Leptospira noguchii serovar Autumnalis str. ZUN142]UOG41683.1 valine--pyruvate transaminase [Leptospira noguchii]UOG48947.1 valine--pyruvate transaminase [Leptospira noguchii]